MDRVTTTIKRQWLAEIIDRTKKVEYREIKPYWERRFSKVKAPFEMRLINGMQARAPEVTVLIKRIQVNRRTREFELHIGKVLQHKNWSPKANRPSR